jgi:hypothetical protein
MPTLTDTREQMLAEMARAFNLGLGLNGGASGNGAVFGGFNPHPHPPHRDASASGNRGGDSHTTDADNGRERDLPPEGSFERFLVELQTDLRAVLSLDSSTQDERGDQARDEEEEEEIEEPLLAATRLSVGSLVPTEPADSVHSADDPDMPALQDVTDDSSSSDGQAESSDDDDGTFVFFTQY